MYRIVLEPTKWKGSFKMEKIKKNFGFGCMRLPMKNGEIDTDETSRMVDAFLDAASTTSIPLMAICKERARKR